MKLRFGFVLFLAFGILLLLLVQNDTGLLFAGPAASGPKFSPTRPDSFSFTDQWYSKLTSGEGAGLAASRLNSLTVLASGYFGARKTLDGGETWTDISSNLPTPYDNQTIWVAHDDDNLLYLSHYNHGWFKSIDGGITWQQIFVSPAAGTTGWGVLSASDHDVLYIQTYTQLYRTADGGTTWQPLDASCSGRVTAVDPQDPDIAYFVGNDLIKTEDGGQSCFQVSPKSFFYVGTEFGNGGLLYGITQYPHAFYRSIDGGANWTQTSAIGFPSGADIWGFAVDPNKRNHLLVSATGWGVRQSCDGGKTWTSLNKGFPVGKERPLTIGFDSLGSYYSLTNGNGVWQYHNSIPACRKIPFNVKGFKSHIGRAGNVVLGWKTGSEIRLAGFDVWRRAGKASWSKINARFLEADYPGDERGSKYRFRDKTVKSGRTYRYLLKVRYLDGRTKWTEVLKVTTP